jgi:RIO-like serine/threonine protein kinase
MTLLKRDLFGTVALSEPADGVRHVIRDPRAARWWLRWLARRLARRETHVLERLSDVRGVPRLLGSDGGLVRREWLVGDPMHVVRPTDPRYFRDALHLLRQLHARCVVHNDLAKEPNWLVTPAGSPALVDFQLALHAPRRGRLFRALAYDDVRHLLKHKRSYVPQRLTARQRRMLARPSLASRLWMASGKPVYRFVTRRILRWADREGAGDRNLG